MADSNEEKIETLTPEELKAEQEALSEKKEDEVRASVIEKFGFDEVSDADKIDKLVADKMEDYKRLSKAIGAKIKHRTEADTLRKQGLKPKTPDQVKKEQDDLDAKLDKKLAETLEKRDLENLELPDELKTEIQRVAQIQGVTIKKAMSDPYIAAKLDQHKKDVAAEEAAVKRTGGKGGKVKLDINDPPQVDLKTPEGRKQWKDWKDAVRDQG